MTARTSEFSVRTGRTAGLHDITSDCARGAAELSAGQDGLLHVFVPHATAGIAVLELGAGSDVDLMGVLADFLPADGRWRHTHGTPGHGRSHVLPAFVPPFTMLPVVGGSLSLGTWQSIAIVDLNVDNAIRRVRLTFLS